jgi:hypothetical protein
VRSPLSRRRLPPLLPPRLRVRLHNLIPHRPHDPSSAYTHHGELENHRHPHQRPSPPLHPKRAAGRQRLLGENDKEGQAFDIFDGGTSKT